MSSIIKALSIMHITFVLTAIITEKPIPVARSFCATSNALLVLPATKTALTLLISTISVPINFPKEIFPQLTFISIYLILHSTRGLHHRS